MAQKTNDVRRVRDVMTSNPECVTEKDSLRDAARIMKSADTGVVPVVDGKKVIGLVTDRDIVVRVIADGKDPMKASVRDAMTTGVRTVKEDMPLDQVLDLMSNAQIRRVPVVNASNEIIGIVSVGDLTEQASRGEVGEAVKEISQAPPNN
jgi:CBS domain-containing protein